MDEGRTQTQYFRGAMFWPRPCNSPNLVPISWTGITQQRQQTTAEYLLNWLTNHKKNLRDTSAENYRWILETHVIPVIGSILLRKLRREHIEELYAAKATYSLNTRQRIHGILRTALTDAQGKKLIFEHPCPKDLRPAKRNKPEDRGSYSITEIFDISDSLELNAEDEHVNAMTDDELELFLRVAYGTRFYAAYLLAARRGPRRGEILGLAWRDIDFRRKTLTIYRSLVVCNGRLVFHVPKTERSRRTISLSDELVEAFRKHLSEQNRQKMERRNTYKDHGLVFTTVDGKPFCPNRFLGRHFKKLLKRADKKRKEEQKASGILSVQDKPLTSFCFHDLRHTAATMMLKDGVNIKIVSQVLGHASEAFTMQVYQHVLPGMQEEALRKYDALR